MSGQARLGAGLALVVFAVPVGVFTTAPTINGQTILALLMLAAGAYLAATARVGRRSDR